MNIKKNINPVSALAAAIVFDENIPNSATIRYIITIPAELSFAKSEICVGMYGTGLASGENRALDAVNQALESPLLDSNDIYGYHLRHCLFCKNQQKSVYE